MHGISEPLANYSIIIGATAEEEENEEKEEKEEEEGAGEGGGNQYHPGREIKNDIRTLPGSGERKAIGLSIIVEPYKKQ